MADRHDRLLVAPAGGEAATLGGTVAVLGARRAACALDQRRAEPAVAFAGFARLPPERTPVIAGADASQGGGVGRGREVAHVVAEFGQDLLGAAAGDSGDSIEPRPRRPKRVCPCLDPRIEERDLALQELGAPAEPAA